MTALRLRLWIYHAREMGTKKTVSNNAASMPLRHRSACRSDLGKLPIITINAVYNVDCRCTDGRTGVSFRVPTIHPVATINATASAVGNVAPAPCNCVDQNRVIECVRE